MGNESMKPVNLPPDAFALVGAVVKSNGYVFAAGLTDQECKNRVLAQVGGLNSFWGISSVLNRRGLVIKRVYARTLRNLTADQRRAWTGFWALEANYLDDDHVSDIWGVGINTTMAFQSALVTNKHADLWQQKSYFLWPIEFVEPA